MRSVFAFIYPSHLRQLMEMAYHAETSLLGEKERQWDRWEPEGGQENERDSEAIQSTLLQVKGRWITACLFQHTKPFCALMRMWIGLSWSQYQAHPFIYSVVETHAIASIVLRCYYIPVREAFSAEGTDTGCRLYTAFIKLPLCSPCLMKYCCALH